MKWIMFWAVFTVGGVFLLSYSIGAGSVVAISSAGLLCMLTLTALITNIVLYIINKDGIRR